MKATRHSIFSAPQQELAQTALRLPPLEDLAKEAGVSLSTVDRAVHHRPGVSARSVHRVTEAIQRLQQVSQASHERNWLLCFLLLPDQDGLSDQVRRELNNLSHWLAEQGARVDVRTIDSRAPAAAVAAVKRLRGQYDAIVAMLPDHLIVREAMETALADGTCFVSLASGVSSRLGGQNFVGIDNVAAGHTAAALLGRFARSSKGQVGILLGSHGMKHQADRLRGFREAMLRSYPDLELLEPVECNDRNSQTQDATAALLSQRPQLVGLYSIGAGNRGVHAALRAHDAGGGPSWVCHELTADAREALLDGSASAVIGQCIAQTTRAACRLAINQLLRQPGLHAVESPRIEIYLKENLP